MINKNTLLNRVTLENTATSNKEVNNGEVLLSKIATIDSNESPRVDPLMKEFRILVINSDRSAGINFSKCLQMAKSEHPEYRIIGTSDHPIRCQLTNNDTTVLIPNDNKNQSPLDIVKYVENSIKAKIDLVYETRSGNHMLEILKHRDKIPTFLPKSDLVNILEDKFKTYEILSKFNIDLPKSYLIKNEGDLIQAINNLDTSEFWVRETKGYGGNGAFPAIDKNYITDEINKRNGWGHYMISERLPNESKLNWRQRLSDTIHPGEMVNWIAIYNNGELLAAQSRKRLYFEHKELSLGGVSHTGGIMTLRNAHIFQKADHIIRSLSTSPHGALGIDFLADKDGLLKVTEVQPCRLYTTTHFMASFGINFPEIFVEASRGNNIRLAQKIDPVEPGMIWAQRFGSDSNIIHRDTVLELLENGVIDKKSNQGSFDRYPPI